MGRITSGAASLCQGCADKVNLAARPGGQLTLTPRYLFSFRMSLSPAAPRISVIIPAHNEAAAIGLVLQEIPAGLAQEVIVVDNNSSDQTGAVARAGGATVLRENRPGYGHACLAGMAHCFAASPARQPDIIVFLDGDHSDYPEEMPALLAPLLRGEADMVIGSRVLGERERGALLPQQRFGNWLATRLMRLRYGGQFTDLGPFRAIRSTALQQLQMEDKTYGWTVEMQVKAARQGLRTVEVPVRYRRRIGVSKVSGTVRGTIGAGYKILWTIFRYW
jgi:glycosyltransferase involved in cell wall biosynthesis